MNCPDCGFETVAFVVPNDYRNAVDEPSLSLCTHCLSLHPATQSDVESDPDMTAVSDAFPTDETAVPMALVVGLLDSLALHRAAVETLLERIERAGTDPLLVIDRLSADPTLDPKIDLTTRRRQVEQLR